ncbi:hypothetical protein BOTBODRAFT_185471 [Botryobasidium botryosum FD-172 SS1]|uniref:FUN14 domain-containing protein n=1 Tax=Botryobasidium botryosum (strain FD-172 SS1) TaxID=930990 RepID=A0A067N1Q0_BOTB1|nr:hypothetical protein BOTBODRAFT_185471 [Botryobasidium botryosum FD-172 SS1]
MQYSLFRPAQHVLRAQKHTVFSVSRAPLRSSFHNFSPARQTLAAPARPAANFKGNTFAFPRVGLGLGLAASVSTLGLGLSAWRKQQVNCDPVSPPAAYGAHPATTPPQSPPPKSSVSVYELSFGTVCGICAGVFIKKGAKALAFFLGGVYVLLQYLGATQLVSVNWSKAASTFEKRFHTAPTEAGGSSRAPTVYSLWTWLINFLTADFQPRATFLAGFVLGLRIG